MRGGNYHTRVPLPYFPVLGGCELLRLMIREINVDIRWDLLHLPCLRGHCPEVQSSISTLLFLPHLAKCPDIRQPM